MHNQDVSSDVRQIAHRFAATRPMRRGSLSVRFIKCNKPGCRCGEDPRPDTGRTPAWSEPWASGANRVWFRPSTPMLSERRLRRDISFVAFRVILSLKGVLLSSGQRTCCGILLGHIHHTMRPS